MALQPGDTLGAYTIEAQVGSGGMATVYRAHHARLERTVAVKVMHANFTANPAFRSRFEREAKIVARLEHLHIVPVYDYDEHDQQPYLVMKYIEGETLKDRLQAGPLPLDETLRVLDAVADALTYAHERGVLHRDIKPSNIMLGADGRTYLTDFGLARLAAAGESTMSADVMLGTPHYISPEQAKGETDLDARTDIYALGVVLHELVTGRVPFTGDTPYAIVHDHIYAPLPDPRQINPAITGPVADVLRTALAKQPAARYATPRALVDAFKAALRDDSVAAPPAQATPPEPFEPVEVDAGEAGPTYSGTGGSHAPTPADFGDRMAEFGERMGEWGERFGERMEAWGKDVERRVSVSVDIDDDDDEGDSAYERRLADMSEEERLRERVKRRIKKRRDDLSGLLTNIFFFIIIGVLLFDLDGWLQAIARGQVVPNGGQWIAAFWLLGVVANFFDYYTTYGLSGDRQERIIQREIAREQQRRERLGLSGVAEAERGEKAKRKAKNDEALADVYAEPGGEGGVRLTGDGELTESFIDEIDAEERRRRR